MDFSSLKEEKVTENLDKVSRGLLEHGVTAYCPTLVTSSKDYYRRILPLIPPRTGGRINGAAILGKPRTGGRGGDTYQGCIIYRRKSINCYKLYQK